MKFKKLHEEAKLPTQKPDGTYDFTYVDEIYDKESNTLTLITGLEINDGILILNQPQDKMKVTLQLKTNFITNGRINIIYKYLNNGLNVRFKKDEIFINGVIINDK